MPNNNIVKHPIADNRLEISNSEYFGLGLHKVIYGEENESRQEIAVNEATGLNYARNAVEEREVYNLSTQAHHPWFVLALETGSRG